ncbi:PEP-CTERM sorting domain-containing protein [Oxalobacteraceae bacterium]|nr:PEP-CTERM sorting domain-containing protein [Oxalobacteraceae bacterium]
MKAWLTNSTTESYVGGSTETIGYFTLAPKATLYIKGDVSVMQGNYVAADWGHRSQAYAQATIGYLAYGSYWNPTSQLTDFNTQFFTEAPKTYAGEFYLQWRNPWETDMQIAVTLATHSSIYAFPLPLPVPEPTSYAMLAGGLLLLGAVARRKGKQA